jgi:hypothetical protein
MKEKKPIQDPEAEINKVLERKDQVWKHLNTTLVEEKRKKYVDWVNESILNGFDLPPEDIETPDSTGHKVIKFVHIPTQLYSFSMVPKSDSSAYDSGKAELLRRIPEHLNDWREVSEDFRQKYGITVGQAGQ